MVSEHPKVVLLHGFGENPKVWDAFINLLSPDFTYLALDYSCISSCISMPDYALWLNKELNNQDVIIVGHSMGAYIALEYVNRYPENVLGLGIFNSTAQADSPDKQLKREKTIEFISKNSSKKFLEDFVPLMFKSKFRKANKEYIKGLIPKDIPEEALIAATMAMAGREDYRELISRLNMPILYIIGTQDQFIDLESCKNQANSLVKPFTLVLDSIAHAGMLEAPQLTAALVNEFVKAC